MLLFGKLSRSATHNRETAQIGFIRFGVFLKENVEYRKKSFGLDYAGYWNYTWSIEFHVQTDNRLLDNLSDKDLCVVEGTAIGTHKAKDNSPFLDSIQADRKRADGL